MDVLLDLFVRLLQMEQAREEQAIAPEGKEAIPVAAAARMLSKLGLGMAMLSRAVLEMALGVRTHLARFVGMRRVRVEVMGSS